MVFLKLANSKTHQLSWAESFAARTDFEQSSFVPEISCAMEKIMQIRNVLEANRPNFNNEIVFGFGSSYESK